MNWLYLLSGGLALYTVETADKAQPLYITITVAFLLCVFPASIGSLYWLRIQRLLRNGLIKHLDD